MKDTAKVLSGGLPVRLLEFSKDVSLASVIEAIKAVPDNEVTLKLPDDTPWLKNPVNEKILRKAVQQFGKTVKLDGKPDEPVKPIKITEVKDETPEPEHHQEELSVKDDAGFVVGGDIMDGANPKFEPAKELHEEEEPINLQEPAEQAPTIPLIPKKDFELGGSRGGKWLGRARRYWPVSIGLALLLLLGAGWYVLYALPRADVKVVVAEQSLSRDAAVTASTAVTAVNADSRKIPATTKSSNQNGTLKTSATGKQTVGTQAKGSVTLFNKTASTKTFSAGTQLQDTINGKTLTFILDAAVTVPAATFSDTGTTYGQAQGSATAKDIGPDYNINAGDSMTIVGTLVSDANAKSAAAFTGGSSKDVQVISQADLDKLTSDLTSQLTDKAKQDLTGGNNSNLQAVDQAFKTTVTNKSFDHKIGDQATDVTLSLSLTISATLYNTQDMKDVLTKILSQAVPDGFELGQDNIETSADFLNSEQNGDLDFTGHIKANLIPKFDHDALAKNLAGKKPAAAETYLKDIPSVVSYQVNIWPNLPVQIQSFPHDVKRIHINVTVQQ